jgi:hypothetical protein
VGRAWPTWWPSTLARWARIWPSATSTSLPVRQVIKMSSLHQRCGSGFDGSLINGPPRSGSVILNHRSVFVSLIPYLFIYLFIKVQQNFDHINFFVSPPGENVVFALAFCVNPDPVVS